MDSHERHAHRSQSSRKANNAGVEWDAPVRGFSDHEVSGARDLHAILRSRFDGIKLVSLSGSLAAGLGHHFSDLDVDVVAGSYGQRQELVQVSGLEFQLNFLDAETVEDLVALASDDHALELGSESFDVDDKRLTQLVRLAIGHRIFLSEDFASVMSNLDHSRVRCLLMGRGILRTAALVEDALGALRWGDPTTAISASRLALELAIDVVLASEGDFYVHQKFLHRRVGRSSSCRHLAEELWQLTNVGPAFGCAIDDVQEVVEARVMWATSLINQVVLVGWDRPIVSVTRPIMDSKGPRRHIGFCLMRTGQEFLLIGPDRGMRMTPALAILWASLDGITSGTPEDFRSSLPSSLGKIPESQLRSGLEKLVAADVASM